MKGYIVNTIEKYESKQAEIAILEGEKRWAGRIDKEGKVRPDIKLKNGNYFIPHYNGPDTIDISDIEKAEL